MVIEWKPYFATFSAWFPKEMRYSEWIDCSFSLSRCFYPIVFSLNTNRTCSNHLFVSSELINSWKLISIPRVHYTRVHCEYDYTLTCAIGSSRIGCQITSSLNNQFYKYSKWRNNFRTILICIMFAQWIGISLSANEEK